MKKRKKLYIILFSLIPVLIIITIAYAALSTTLTVSWNKVSVEKQTWSVGFVVPTGGSVTATTSSTSSTGFSCGNATVTSTTVTIADTKLSKPGDKCTWPVTVKNNGSLIALLSEVTLTQPSGVTCSTSTTKLGMVCGNITYRVTTDANGDNTLGTNTEIAAGGSLQLYISARYNQNNALTSTQTVQTGAAFKLKYAQK